jgi:hypothetical protein
MRWLMLVGIADEVLEGVIFPELLVGDSVKRSKYCRSSCACVDLSLCRHILWELVLRQMRVLSLLINVTPRSKRINELLESV